MASFDMACNIKELFPDYVIIIKRRNYSYVYNDDASIIYYLFKYKYKVLYSDKKICKFETYRINKIINLFKRKCINYIILDRVHNYDEIDKMVYKKYNGYNDILLKANNYIDKMNRIEKIKKYLINNSNRLEEVEKILYN